MAERLAVGDLVVVVPGITGSRLSRNGVEVWGISLGASIRALLTLGRSLKRMELPDGIGDNDPNDGVTATGLMNDLHIIPGLWTPVRGYSGLVDWLRSHFTLVDRDHAAGQPANLLTFPYDWRLSNRLNAQRLKVCVEKALEDWRRSPGHSEAKIIFLCHSMGGLVARYYLEHLGGSKHARALVTFGTPHRGAINALLDLVNGHRQGWWKFGVDLTRVVRSLPSVYQLLPTYACIDDPKSSSLLRLTEIAVPELDDKRVVDAMAFHDEIIGSEPLRTLEYSFDAVVGIQQPTMASARVDGHSVVPMPTMRDKTGSRISHVDERGDGTVPRFSAELAAPSLVAPNRVFRSEQHGSLHLNAAVHDHVLGVLTGSQVIYRAESHLVRPSIGIDVPNVVAAGKTADTAIVSEDDSLLLDLVVRDESGATSAPAQIRNEGGGNYRASFLPAVPGTYEIQVRSPFLGSDVPDPVTGALLVWDPALDDET